jgi:hypothetical protein
VNLSRTYPGIAPQKTHPTEAARRYDAALQQLAELLPESEGKDGDEVLRLAAATLVELRREVARLIRAQHAASL